VVLASVFVVLLAACSPEPEPPTATASPVPTPTTLVVTLPTRAPSATPMATPTATSSPIPTPTETPSPVPTATATPSATATTIPSPTATPSPIPTQTPSPIPTATPLPTATHTPSPEPTAIPPTPVPPSPTAAPPSRVNLTPSSPSDWEGPLVVAALEQIRQNTTQAVGSTTYVSWAVANKGELSVNKLFFVDLYFDGVEVARWSGNRLDNASLIVITDWDGLQDMVRITPGDHTLKLVVDPTNLIRETDETDNEIEITRTWLPDDNGTTPTPVPDRLPDLAPHTPDDWSAALIASPYENEVTDGPLSVDMPTYVSAVIWNQGLVSISDDVWIYLYVDEVLVDMRLTSGMLAEDPAARSRFQDLLQRVPLSPGVHTLKVVADPNDLVVESNEDNNVFEREFAWGTGTVASPTPVPTASPLVLPAAPTLPNLVPGWRFGWDGPIVVSHEPESFLDGPLTVDRPSLVDILVFNRSTQAAGPYSVDLYLDGEKIQRFEMDRGSVSREVNVVGDWEGLAENAPLTEGIHVLKMVIDPDNVVSETDETDNTYEKTFSWGKGEIVAAEPRSYDEGTLRQMLSALPELLDIRDNVIDGNGEAYAEEVLRVADAGYYLVTGRSMFDERVNVLLLGRQDYLDWIESSFDNQFAIRDPSTYESLALRKEVMRARATGFKTRDEGKVTVVVDAERGVADVINSLAHELGHMLQDLSTVDESESDVSYLVQGIHEAEAQQFQRTMWLAIEEFTGLSLTSYPTYANFRNLTDERLSAAIRNRGRDEHELGLLLQWLVVIDDPAFADLRQKAIVEFGLDASESLKLFEYLVNLDPNTANAYVTERLEALPNAINLIRAAAWGRLQPVSEIQYEGQRDLRVAALLMP
jgi:hypothetical protein